MYGTERYFRHYFQTKYVEYDFFIQRNVPQNVPGERSGECQRIAGGALVGPPRGIYFYVSDKDKTPSTVQQNKMTPRYYVALPSGWLLFWRHSCMHTHACISHRARMCLSYRDKRPISPVTINHKIQAQPHFLCACACHIGASAQYHLSQETRKNRLSLTFFSVVWQDFGVLFDRHSESLASPEKVSHRLPTLFAVVFFS